jgi:hypothetical protein
MNKKLDERMKERAINELLKARTLDGAAKKLGIAPRTLSRWLDDPEFLNAYQDAKRELLRVGIAGLTKRVSLAAETLGEIAKQKGKPYQAARVAASVGIVRLAFDADVLDNLEERIRNLETQRSDD